VVFRANLLKNSPEEAARELARLGLEAEPVLGYPAAFILRRGTVRELQATPLYREGSIYVQSLASMMPVLALAPEPGHSVLDLAAAPGGKTTQIAALTHGQGWILANDSSRERFFKLKWAVETQGAKNVELSLQKGELLGRKYADTFDRVLVDAPCSSEGRFRAGDPASFRYWKMAKIREMARKQKRLLRAGFETLKAGGILVYSTCTFAPEENEEVVQWTLEKCGENFVLEPIPIRLDSRVPALTSWEGKVFDRRIVHAARLLPTEILEAFFIARIRKT
jgi:16S rRNA (cytosine1407-C5)-methyltransferase